MSVFRQLIREAILEVLLTEKMPRGGARYGHPHGGHAEPAWRRGGGHGASIYQSQLGTPAKRGPGDIETPDDVNVEPEPAPAKRMSRPIRPVVGQPNYKAIIASRGKDPHAVYTQADVDAHDRHYPPEKHEKPIDELSHDTMTRAGTKRNYQSIAANVVHDDDAAKKLHQRAQDTFAHAKTRDDRIARDAWRHSPAKTGRFLNKPATENVDEIDAYEPKWGQTMTPEEEKERQIQLAAKREKLKHLPTKTNEVDRLAPRGPWRGGRNAGVSQPLTPEEEKERQIDRAMERLAADKRDRILTHPEYDMDERVGTEGEPVPWEAGLRMGDTCPRCNQAKLTQTNISHKLACPSCNGTFDTKKEQTQTGNVGEKIDFIKEISPELAARYLYAPGGGSHRYIAAIKAARKAKRYGPEAEKAAQASAEKAGSHYHYAKAAMNAHHPDSHPSEQQ